MKKLIIISLFLVFAFGIMAQTIEKVDSDKFKDVKMLKSEQSEEVQVEIRKPDNASLMPRQDTDYENTAEKKMIEKLKESNKMLY